MTIDEVLVRRRPVPSVGGTVMGNPSQSGGLFTISTPKPRHVFTILCWNIQDFEEGKSEANPYVNVLINETLKALDVDLAILLETGENNATNLTNIDFKVAHATDYKQDMKDEEDWDAKELASEAEARWEEMQKSNPESPTYDPSLNVAPTYQNISSALTGKIYYPPSFIYPFHHPEAQKKSLYWPRINKGLAKGLWKREWLAYEPLRLYYQIFQTSTGTEITDLAVIPDTETAEADLEFRVRVCGTCNQKYGRSTTCVTCGDLGPYTTSVENLAWAIQRIAFSFSYRVVLESYGVLVKPTALGMDGPGGFIYADGLLAGIQRFRCDLLLRKPPAPRPLNDVVTEVQQKLNAWKSHSCFVNGSVDLFTQNALVEYQEAHFIFTAPSKQLDAQTLKALDVETFIMVPVDSDSSMAAEQQVFRPENEVIAEVQAKLNAWKANSCVVNGVLDVGTQTALEAYQQAHGIFTAPSGQLDPPTLQALFVNTHMPGDLLSYQDKGSRYYGRCPFVIPLLLRLKGATKDSWVPLVTFHAPFGTKKKGEPGKAVFEARADALREALHGNVGEPSKKPFGAVDAGILMGDLNLDISAPTTQQEGEVAAQAYGDLASAGFINQIPKVPSSLIGLYNTQWKKQKLSSSYDGANWHGTDGAIRNFTSSAYDNVLVKGTDLGNAVLTAGIIDVLAFIKANLSRLDLSHAESEYVGFSGLADEHKAFFIYHRYVSDHLPILLDIEVEPMSLKDRESFRDHVLTAKHRMMQETERLWKLTYDGVLFLDVCPPAYGFVQDLPASTLIIGMVDELLPPQTARISSGTIKHICDIRSLPATPQKGDMLGVVVTKPSPANDMLAAVRCLDFKNPDLLFLPVDPQEKTALMVGKVHRISTDGKRFMLLSNQYYCVVEKRAEWPTAPDVGTWAVLVLKNPATHPVQVKKKT